MPKKISGLPGMSSIHANSARDALVKLSTLPLLAGRNIDSSFVVPTVASCIDIVVHCELGRGGQRRVVEVVAPTGNVTGGVIEASPVFASGPRGLEPTGGYPARLAKFAAAGLDPAVVLARGGVTLALGLALGAGVLLMFSPVLWPRTESSRRMPGLPRVRDRLVQAGLARVSPATVVVVSLLLGVAGAAVAHGIWRVAVLAVAAGAVASLVPWLLIGWRARSTNSST